VAPQARTTDCPLQSIERRIELDTLRHRLVSLPLCGRLDLQSILDLPVVPYWFNTPSSRLPSGCALRFSRPVPEEILGRKISSPLVTFRPTVRCTRPLPPSSRRDPKVLMGSKTDSPEVYRPFSALDAGSDPHREFHLPAVQRAQAFSTSPRLTPPVPVTALFHAAGTPGVCPFRAFPSLAAVASLDALCLHVVAFRFQSRSTQQAALPGPFPGQPPSRRCSTSESVHTMVEVNRPPRPLLSWISAPPRVSQDR